MDKKNTMLLTVIAVATLLVAVVGATFAYFSVTGANDGNTTAVTLEAEDVGTVALTNPTTGLYLGVTAADMASTKAGTSYYATVVATDGAQANYDTASTPREVAVATVTGGETDTKYNCSFTLEVTVTGDMKDSLTTGDAVLTLAGATTQSYDLSGGDTTFTVNMNDLTGTNTTQTVTAVVQLNNRADATTGDGTGNQNALAGKALSVSLQNTDFACDTVE